LRLRTVSGVNDEQHAVDHVHDTFDFTAEVGVSGSVDDVDVEIFVFERGVLGADGDALFTLQVHRVHDAFFGRDGLIGAKSPGLLEQAVDQRGLAMVDVRDNCDVTNMFH